MQEKMYRCVYFSLSMTLKNTLPLLHFSVEFQYSSIEPRIKQIFFVRREIIIFFRSLVPQKIFEKFENLGKPFSKKKKIEKLFVGRVNTSVKREKKLIKKKIIPKIYKRNKKCLFVHTESVSSPDNDFKVFCCCQ